MVGQGGMTTSTHVVESSASFENLERLADAGRLYAILDACDEPRVPELVQDLGSERAVSLYRGGPEEHLWAIAPYLVRVDPQVLEWIADELWSEPAWGIFAISEVGLEGLRRHFRKFLMVKAPTGEQWYFRYYDPRVLRKFLPTCTPEEVTELFGPVRSYGITDPETGELVLLRAA